MNISNNDKFIKRKFKAIIAHKGSLPKLYPNYNSFHYNLWIELEIRKIADEPLSIIAVNNLVSYTIYARDNNIFR